MASVNPHILRLKRICIILSIIIFVPILLYLIELGLTYKKISYNIIVAGQNLSGLEIERAEKLLSEKINVPDTIIISGPNQDFKLDTQNIDLSYDFNSTAIRAYNLTRSGNVLFDVNKKVELLFSSVNIGLISKFDEQKLVKFISVVSGQDLDQPKYPSIQIINGKINIDRGAIGQEVDQQKLRVLIAQNLAFALDSEIVLPIVNIDPTLSDTELAIVQKRAEILLGKNIVIKFEDRNIDIAGKELVSFLETKGGYNDEKIYTSIYKIAQLTERPSQNPKFQFENGKVTEFLPAKEGVEVKKEELRQTIIKKLDNIENSEQKTADIDLPVKLTPPIVTTDKVNNIGIKELLAKGTSTYFHSIPGRVHNVQLAASRINGTLVAPGETFSFNQTLGDVSKFTGYKEAYIISQGKTILGDGGGVCQVSTTLFRALLNAGLPITERSSHAYRVSYYEQSSPPGLDATVYGPSPDLKFVNDTENHILIQAIADTKNYSLIFELYGTKDGREAKTTKPVVTNVTAPPEDLYQDDPTLPVGTVKQIDFKAWGAKVYFDYEVIKDGKVIFNKTFVSNYRPWQAIYARGTGPSI